MEEDRQSIQSYMPHPAETELSPEMLQLQESIGEATFKVIYGQIVAKCQAKSAPPAETTKSETLTESKGESSKEKHPNKE